MEGDRALRLRPRAAETLTDTSRRPADDSPEDPPGTGLDDFGGGGATTGFLLPPARRKPWGTRGGSRGKVPLLASAADAPIAHQHHEDGSAGRAPEKGWQVEPAPEPESEPTALLKKGFLRRGDSTGSDSSRGKQQGPRQRDCLNTDIAAVALQGTASALVHWFAVLRGEYGEKLLLLIWASQHMLKGVVFQFQASAVMWVLKEYTISGPQMQVYMSVAAAPWALKPIIGAVSDMFPVMGYRKAPYILVTSLIGVACTAWIGLSTSQSMGILMTVLCLLGMSLQASTCDLLTEAKYSEHIHEKPAHGPDLVSYVWGGVSVGNILAICCVGFLITHCGGPRSVFLASVAPASAIIVPTVLNYFEETPLSWERVITLRRHFMRQSEVIFLCGLMTVLTLFLSVTGIMASDSPRTRLYSASGVLVVLLPAFHCLLRPEIAKVNTFFVLQSALSLTIGGATFYFYTDRPEQYPEGPHFSAWFFATTLGLVSSVMSLVGLSMYVRLMNGWSYRSLILFSNVLVTALSLLEVVIFRRLNLRFGIPDSVFVIFSSVSTVVTRQWQWMPGVLIMSQLCPTGMEATIFALLAGCMNLGSQVADNLGAFMLEELRVHPTGALGESHQFDNLWKASCVATLLPAITILMIPFLVPEARQTDKLLLTEEESATAGSPWSRLRQHHLLGGGPRGGAGFLTNTR